MFIFNATFLKALYSDLFLYVALLNALSLWFFFFLYFLIIEQVTQTPRILITKLCNSIGRLKYTTKFLVVMLDSWKFRHKGTMNQLEFGCAHLQKN
jgi:hypothetical protein